jgi:hypothetical protein
MCRGKQSFRRIANRDLADDDRSDVSLLAWGLELESFRDITTKRYPPMYVLAALPLRDVEI